jgi:hypothetical protein
MRIFRGQIIMQKQLIGVPATYQELLLSRTIWLHLCLSMAIILTFSILSLFIHIYLKNNTINGFKKIFVSSCRVV